MLLFGLLGGLVADRFPRRAVLLVTQSLMGVLSGVLALLAWTGDIRVWHIHLIAALLRILIAADLPARQTFVADMLDQEGVSAALRLNSAAGQLAKVTGPAAVGLLLMRERELRAEPRCGPGAEAGQSGTALRLRSPLPARADQPGGNGGYLWIQLPGLVLLHEDRLRPRTRGVRAPHHTARARSAAPAARWPRPGAPRSGPRC
ncbi:MFS transporter [Streptomyces xinghaiensis]|uniref:MFS transporter n=1 Tax=Streptomyces xinghaiensis TaxID=1038928 RepID=UPI000BAFFF03|nr:hypothetical protein [Streptomyces sp. SID5475]